MGRISRALTLAGLCALCAAPPAAAQTTPAPPAGPAQSLTITPQAREQRAPALTEADRRALDLFAAQPRLTPSPGLPIGPAYGPQDEDCVRAGGEVFCRQ